MADPKPLEVRAMLEESLSMQGALGALAYVVLKGLQAGGAEAKVIASVRVLMQEHFQRLSDPDCNALCDVLFARMQAESQKGKWYT